MMTRRGVLLLVVLVLFAPSAAAASVTIHAGTNADGSLYFSPKTVKVTKSDDVTLTLVNDDSDQPHDWALLSYNGRDIEAYVSAGRSKTVQFEADAIGTFRIVCQIVGHKQRGMEGSFVVASNGIPGFEPGVAAGLLAVAAIATRRGRS